MSSDSEKETKKSSKSSDKYSEKVKYCSAIASPLANRKTTKHLMKFTKKAAKEKVVRRGVKEVVKAIRKGEKGLCIIAGDISPVDVITHLPVLCEENDIKYIYVPSKDDLGASALTKRPTSCVLISPNTKKNESAEVKEKMGSILDEVKAAWASSKK